MLGFGEKNVLSTGLRPPPKPNLLLAVAWVASHPAVTAPIIGARNVEQLEPSLKAAEFEMSAEMRAEISRFSPEPPPATDRDEERTSFNFSAALLKK